MITAAHAGPLLTAAGDMLKPIAGFTWYLFGWWEILWTLLALLMGLVQTARYLITGRFPTPQVGWLIVGCLGIGLAPLLVGLVIDTLAP